ncbi:MAG TPA: spore coat protein U domain-containing protein [Burkholderiales bacterium]|nr:spore coat protein U domain-containing protein [Burkholderiales bacterium]
MSTFRITGLLARLAAGLLSLVPIAAGAAVTCSVSVTSITTSFSNALGNAGITSGAYTISCTRLSTDPNTFAWQLRANNGIHAAGNQNRGLMGATTINYDIYRSTTINNGNRWQTTTATAFSGTLAFVGASLNASTTGTFYANVPTGQNPAAGTYTDTVTATLLDQATGTITYATTTFGVSILNQAACEITAPPGNLNFTYTSFQGAAAAASTTFALRCTNLHPYTMALDVASSVLLGLTYTVSLSQTSATGTGASQTFTINGGITAGQSGTCSTASCTGTQTRTLTITY